MKSKYIIRLLIVLVVIAALAGVFILGSKSVSGKYTKHQAELISQNELDNLYDTFTPELMNEYSDKAGFLNTDATLFLVDPIKEVKQAYHTGSILGGTYRYHLVRADDPEQGYTLDIEITPGLWGKQIKGITIQPVRFAEE